MNALDNKNRPLTRIVTDQLIYAGEYLAAVTLVRVLAALTWLMFLICLLYVDANASDTNEYKWTEVGDTSKENITVRAINASDVVAGQIDGRAFVLSNGKMKRYSSSDLEDTSSSESVAVSVNDNNTAVGSIGSFVPLPEAGLQSSAAVFINGTTRLIDNIINVSFSANAINNVGTIVGGIGESGFVRRPGHKLQTVAPLSTRNDYPNSNGLQLTSINEIGDVAGASTINIPKSFPLRYVTAGVQRAGRAENVRVIDSSSYPVHGFIQYSGGKKTDIGHLPGFVDSFATAINKRRVVVGYSGTSSSPTQAAILGPSQAWIWKDGRLKGLRSLKPGESTFAYGINDNNIVVGCSGNRAVRWIDSAVKLLSELAIMPDSVALTCARAINQAGSIAGDATNSGRSRGFVLQKSVAAH